MAKGFNLGRIKGISSDDGAGSGLLNAASKVKASTLKRTEYIPFSSLHPNPDNDRSLEDIDKLAALIKNGGLDQPLVVMQLPDGDYMILTGHRRYYAIKKLIESGDWNAESLVEVKVKNLNEVNLPLNDTLKIKFCKNQTNAYREKTDADIAKEIRDWKEIIAALREEGVEILILDPDENNDTEEKVEIQIAGERTRDIIAEQMHISKAQIGKFDKVENQGSELLRTALLENTINVSTAADIASLPKEKQDEVLQSILEDTNDNSPVTHKKVTAVLTNEAQKKEEERQKQLAQEGKTLITEKALKNDTKDLFAIVKSSDGVVMDKDEYESYLECISTLKKLLNQSV